MTKNGQVAIENAEKLRNLTSGDEDAFFIAKLLHDLGTQLRNFKTDLVVNGWAEDRAVEFNVQTPDGVEPSYLLSEQGSATTPKGEKCKSYGDRIKELDKGIADLWASAEQQRVDRKIEDEFLPEIQKKALEQAKVKAATPDA